MKRMQITSWAASLLVFAIGCSPMAPQEACAHYQEYFQNKGKMLGIPFEVREESLESNDRANGVVCEWRFISQATAVAVYVHDEETTGEELLAYVHGLNGGWVKGQPREGDYYSVNSTEWKFLNESDAEPEYMSRKMQDSLLTRKKYRVFGHGVVMMESRRIVQPMELLEWNIDYAPEVAAMYDSIK